MPDSVFRFLNSIERSIRTDCYRFVNKQPMKQLQTKSQNPSIVVSYHRCKPFRQLLQIMRIGLIKIV